MNAPARHHDPALPGRLCSALIGLAVLAWALHLTEFAPGVLFEAAAQRETLRFLASFVPPRLDGGFLRDVLPAAWRTLAIATCGVTLAWLAAVPAALLLTRVLSFSALGRPGRDSSVFARALRTLVRWLMVFLRSVPELVWALLLVRVVGLGAAAGVFAIAITYAGMLAKVYAEILESAPAAPTLALLHHGAGRVQAVLFGLLPQCADELISYTVYRWECAVRSSVVLGMVGAGGLGQMLEGSMKMFAGDEVATLLLVFVLLVALADLLSAWLRRAWA
ncbi:MAG: ABC transporter permease subunit [Pseudomonadota bacterium]|nr:ABC transporter permease subunit [Pseudomonadota bacterium]